MKYNSREISINEFLNRNKIISLFFNLLFFVFLTSLRLISKLFSNKEGNISVIALHRIGDTIFTIPAIREIQKYHNRKVNIVCFPESVPIYELAFIDAEFCVLEHEIFYLNGRIASHYARRKLKSFSPSIIYDLTGLMASASLIFTSNAYKIIGSNAIMLKAIYDKFIEIRKIPKLTDIYFDAISPEIKVSERSGIKDQHKLVNRQGSILIHPFAGWKEKEWGLKKFISLSMKLNECYDSRIIIQEGQINRDVLCEIENSNVKLIQLNSVNQLIECIKGASLFIGNDSGPVNIANYLSIPSLTIFGSTSPEYAVTNADHQIFIQKSLNCSARQAEKFCMIGLTMYRCSGTQCMNLLSFEEVYTSLLPLLEKYCQRKVSKDQTFKN